MEAVKEGYVSVPGGRVWFRELGSGRRGIPLLVVHGGPGVPHDYLESLEPLADERPVVFYDQLGCGRSACSDKPDLWQLGRFVEELSCVRADLRLDRLHVLGQSWGAALSLEYLLAKRSAGVVSLILSAPLINARRWADDQRTLLSKMPEEVQGAVREAERAGQFEGQAYQDAILAYYRRHLCRLDPWPESLTRAFEKLVVPIYLAMWGPSEFTVTGNLREFDRSRDLGCLELPVLFTAGEHDEALPETVASFASAVPGARLRVFEGASHEHHLEQPEEYLAVLRGFLRSADEA